MRISHPCAAQVKIEDARALCAGDGHAGGTFWWLDREFDEAKKYMGPKQIARAEAARELARATSATTLDALA